VVLDCRHWILLSSSCTLVWLGIEFIPLQTSEYIQQICNLNYKSYILKKYSQKVPESSAGSRRRLEIWTVLSWAGIDDCAGRSSKRDRYYLSWGSCRQPIGIIRSNWSLKILRSTDKCTPWKASSHFREREEYEFKNHEGVGRRTLRAIQCAGHVLFLEWAMVLFPSVVDSML